MTLETIQNGLNPSWHADPTQDKLIQEYDKLIGLEEWKIGVSAPEVLQMLNGEIPKIGRCSEAMDEVRPMNL